MNSEIFKCSNCKKEFNKSSNYKQFLNAQISIMFLSGVDVSKIKDICPSCNHIEYDENLNRELTVDV